MSNYKRCAGLLSLALAATLIIAAAPAGEGAQETMTFSMTAQYIGTTSFGSTGGGQTPLIIGIEKLNTPDERDAMEEIFKADGMQALADALRAADRIGFIRAPSNNTIGWQLRYAMIYAGPDNTRIIRLATDRPISFEEATNRLVRSWDFNVSLIELVVDEEGNGEGVIYAGVEFAYNETDDTFGIKSITTQPIRLNNVRLQK